MDLSKNILSVADGPASFNAEMMMGGFRATSVDPIYELSAEEIPQRFSDVVDGIIRQVESTPENWVWTYHQSPEHLRKNREKALEYFVKDYESGKREGRYRTGELPDLIEIEDGAYDLALCSHFLFLYSDHFDCTFHQAAIQELLRVASEVRIFPLLTLRGEKSSHVDSVVRNLEANGFEVGKEKVTYEFQRGGNEMLRVALP